MIHVDRGEVPKPKVLDGAASKAAKELKKARTHFGAANPGSFSGFKAYKDKTVRTALNALFHGKCAYCEFYYAASQPMDVEHYRPKGGFVDAGGKLVKPGYWWLAADWDNLLPSCIDCNRRRTHQKEGGGEEKLGKASFFPVADETKRWRQETAVDGEARLLLDPCRDQPERLLRVNGVGKIEGADGITAHEKAMVTESARVYGLNRTGLLTRRHSEVIRLQGIRRGLSLSAKAIKQQVDTTGKPTDGQREALAELAGQILERLRPQTPFTALARQLFNNSLLAKFEAFVGKYFAGDLLDASGAAPAAGEVLSRFVERWAPSGDIDDDEIFSS